MTKLATAVVVFATVLCLGSATPTVKTVFTDVFDFDKGFISGFVNEDVTRSPECLLILEKSKSQLDKVWGDHVYIEERTVDVHVKRLREALGQAGVMIETVRGAGYRLTARPETVVASADKASA